ncbi:MAG: serine/threonine protein phosphatase [Rhodobacteraceae bacterium]|nr:MAG: serine/threonine protein phosphatase [Paracoccaceae bacterium]
MRILAFSDLHHSARQAQEIVAAARAADLVIGAGDFCNMRQDLVGAIGLLEGIAAPMVLVPGNAESHAELAAAAPEGAYVLHGTGVEIAGVRLFGLGYGVPETPFGAWSCDLSEAQAEAMLGACEGADILVTHSPPKGIVDRTSAGVSVGSQAILAAIGRIGPELALCGHIHESWGQSGRVGRSKVVNLGPFATWFDVGQ